MDLTPALGPRPPASETGESGLTLDEVRQVLDAETIWCPEPSVRAEWVVAADLMSDVLICQAPGRLLLTSLVNQQAIRTAAIMDFAGVVFVRGKSPRADVVELAQEKRVPVFVTALPTFEAAGVLYAALRARTGTRDGTSCDG
ncbi:MAG: DRTGG domain-containing protein [Acidobacteriota bacterium]